MIDVNLASKGITGVTVLQLNKECFVGTVHVGMVKERLQKFDAHTRATALASW